MNENSSNQIQLFKSVFKGREDVFAIRWEKPARQSGGGNKSDYVPAYFYDTCRYRTHKMKGGTFQNYNDKTYLPLSDKEITKHLNGEQQIGVYPLLTDNTSWFLLADFDIENWAEKYLFQFLSSLEHFLFLIKVPVLTVCFPTRIFFREKVWKT